MCFPCFQILGGGRNLTLIFSRSIWELHLSNVPSPGLQTSALMISTLETSLQFQKSVGGGVVLRLEKWVSGAYAGHTAGCLRESEGKLWVDKSGHDNVQGEDVIAVLPWDGWWELSLTKTTQIPTLHCFHCILICEPNLTRLLHGSMHRVASVMTVWNQMQPAYAANMWNEALNKRLGTELPSHSICNSLCDIMHLVLHTEGLDLLDLMVETEMRGSSFAELLTIPKQDDWVYSDGKSTSCVVFVLERDKAAGLFDPISSSIQVTEFTIKDAYSLRFFENNSSCLPKWCDDGDDVELLFCQIRGRYRMELLGYIIVDPYPHMNEMCPSLPPKYSRPSDC